MSERNPERRLATINQLSDALENLYMCARVVQKNVNDFSRLERALAGMVVDDSVRGIGFLNRADVFQEPLF